MDEEVINEPAKQPTKVNTHGRWMKYSEFQELEDNKSYNVKIKGSCLIAFSATQPTSGIKVNEISFTKQPDVDLWIMTAK